MGKGGSNYELIGIEPVLQADGRTTRYVPASRERWSLLRKLRYYAELMEVMHGIERGTIRVSKGRASINGVFQYRLFSVSVRGSGIGISPMPYDATRTYIAGVAHGLATASRKLDRASSLNPDVVLAALDSMLATPGSHPSTHLSIIRLQAKRLRAQVAQYATGGE